MAECLRCGAVADWAHGVWEAVGGMLAEPLRRAFDRHLDEHRCGEPDSRSPHYIGGFLNCPEASHLWDLLPEADRVCVGAP